MNFFWKVFFSIILISTVTFSVGSFSLIDFQFSSELDREVNAAYKENDILFYSLNRELKTIDDELLGTYSLGKSDQLETARKELIGKVAQSVTINTSKGTINFRLNDSDYKTIFTGTNINIDNNILKELSSNKKGYEIVKSNSQYYIHAARPITVKNEIMYLENFRNITFLFKGRSEQYKIFYYVMSAMIASSTVVVFIVSSWLSKPLKKLSQATKQIANGNFNQRVSIQSGDEFGKLSKDFNTMVIKLEHMVKELKESARRQEDFVGSFAHELKTPLTSMIGYADMLRSKKMDPEQIILSANYIFQEGKRLESLSMKLMDIMVLKKLDFTMKRTHTKDFFASIKGIMLPVLKKENIEFTVYAEDAILQIEPDLMKTVCMNLLDNARKSIEQVGHIEFLGRWVSDSYLFIVKDTGKGMEESELVKITEAFYMVDKSRSREQGGAGLGLSISSEILNLHGAEMKFQSNPGKGTCVTVYLKGVERV